mgnify:CR=1 FL=1
MSKKITSHIILWMLIQSFLLANISAKEELNVYTYDSFSVEWGLGPILKKEFEAQCNCLVKYKAVEDAVSILNRLKLEKESSIADVVIGFDNNLIAEATATGLFTEHTIGLNDGLLTNLPTSWDDKNFLPFDYGWVEIIYDSKKIASVPDSLDQLINSNESSPTLIIQDPRISTPGLGFILWIKKLYGNKSSQAWGNLSKKIVTVTKNWSESYNLFLKGESDMVLSYTTSPLYHKIMEKTDRYKSFSPKEGNYQQVEVAGILKSSNKFKLSKKFLEFLLSTKIQKQIPMTQWMYPARKVEMPTEFNNTPSPSKSLQFDPTEVFENKKRWIDEWKKSLILAR